VTSREDVLQLAKEVGEKEQGGIHVLVNNAGVAKEKDKTAFSSQGEPDFTSAEAISEHLLKSTHEAWAGPRLRSPSPARPR
jgi:NAD(P)-dependent dehydrogenase (short-subunit alcohol dehydrogenase family)